LDQKQHATETYIIRSDTTRTFANTIYLIMLQFFNIKRRIHQRWSKINEFGLRKLLMILKQLL